MEIKRLIGPERIITNTENTEQQTTKKDISKGIADTPDSFESSPAKTSSVFQNFGTPTSAKPEEARDDSAKDAGQFSSIFSGPVIGTLIGSAIGDASNDEDDDIAKKDFVRPDIQVQAEPTNEQKESRVPTNTTISKRDDD